MKKRLLALCAVLLLLVPLTGCWQETETGDEGLPQPSEEPAESRVILSERFALPYMPDRPPGPRDLP